MSSDSSDVKARVDPAQSATLLSPVRPAPGPLPAQQPASYDRTSDPNWIAGTGRPPAPAAPQGLTTRDMPAPRSGPVVSQTGVPSEVPVAGLAPLPTALPPPPGQVGD